MDSLLLCTADQTPPALTDSQTGGLDSSAPLHSPAENMLSAYETGAATVSDVSDQFDKSTETLSNVPKCLSQEKSTDSNCVKPLSPGCNMAECLPLCSEPAPEGDDSRPCGCFSSSDPVLPPLPDLSHDLISPLSESFSECYVKQEPALYFPLTQENSTPGGARSSASEGLMEPYVTEPLSSFSSEQHQASHLLRSLSNQSDSLGSDSAIAPESDLYIFESETQDFTLSPNLDPQEIKCLEYQPLTQTGVIKGDRNCETHVLMCDSENVVTQCHHGSGEEQTMMDYESDVSQYTRTGPRAPAVDAYEAGMVSVNDARQGRVTDLTSQSRRSDSPIELWLDACQYLTGEDAEDRDVWDKTGHSVTPGGLMATMDLASPPGEIQVSGYSPDGTEGIGWPSDDTRGWGPSVERWSSVDSWASALSDWTGIITSPPEDFTAAFTEIGAEIDALTQALAEVNTPVDTATSTEGKSQEPAVQSQLPMGVQDQLLEAQNIPESPVISGQSCLSLCLEVAQTELQDKEGSQNAECLRDSTPSTQGKSQEPTVQSQQPMGVQDQRLEASMGSYGATGGCGVVIPGSASSTDLDRCHSDPYVESFEPNILISSEEDPIILNIIEDTDLEGQNAPVELIIEEPFGDGVCEVTDERSFSQPGSGAEQEAKRSSESAEVDREETKSSTNLHFLSHTVTNSHVQGVYSQTGLHNNLDTHVPPDTLPDLDGACQLEPRWGSPKFIMPLAPLGIGSSLVRRASSLEGDQIYAKRSLTDNRHLCSDLGEPCILLSNSDGITDKQSLEDDEKLIHKKETTKASSENSSPEGQHNTITQRKTLIEEITDLSRELSNLAVVSADKFIISEENRVAFITLDVNDLFASRAAKPIATAVKSEKAEVKEKTVEKMPHKTHKATSESKPRSKKDKSASHHYGTPAPKKQETVSHHVSAQQVGKQQETHPLTEETHSSENGTAALEKKEANLVIESSVATEKTPSKPHGKKKKKHAQNTTGGKSVGEPLVEVDNGAKAKTAKGRIDMFEAKLGAKAGKSQKDSDQPRSAEKKSQQTEAKASQAEQPPHHTDDKAQQPKNITNPLKDDIIKRRRLSQDKFGKLVGALESKLPKPDFPVKANGGEPKTDAGAARKKAYSEVVKQKIPPKEDPKVVQPIQPMSDSGDPQSLCLWCQFAAVSSDYTVTWSRDGIVLSEIKRSAGDESRVLLTISNASHKDLGKYQCRLTSLHGSVTLDYLLKYEVLSEIVIPPSSKTSSSAPVEVVSEEEDVNCSRLLFKEDFLSHQYFGENQSASIITEKVHFGEGMHRRAFRTKMQAGQIPLLLPGHSCVLKVHNAISYGTKNNEELIHRNFTLAVEECQVQNTAREYIKAYTSAAQSFEGFGETPDIIPIYLVHRPSNDIPYATLEEELIGDFVKYSVRDGKEINLMRRDSEAGQKCCAFQHWVYQKTEGNLLVTDMQGVGMKLTDVGIATCKKGYNGFKGNCATSFIDQFKALHQCNKYCEILDLKSLQPKPKKPASAPKPRPQTSLPAPKKKLFGPTVKGKS